MTRLIFFVLLLSLVSTMADAQQAESQDELLSEVVKAATEQDTFRAIDLIESQGNTSDVAQNYAQLVQGLYYKKKNVPLMLRIGQAGVHYCLLQACDATDDKAALLSTAKMMSFNLSVNCWPGWEDEGISLTSADIAAGHDFARLNLRLAKELDRPADKVASAWWLLGAHQMAAKETEQAIASFDKAAALFVQAKQEDGQWMAKGYAAIAKHMVPAIAEEGGNELQAAVDQLRKLDTDDSRFYADQLESVDKFFTK